MTHATDQTDQESEGGSLDDDRSDRSSIAEVGDRLRLRLRVAREQLIDVVAEHPLTAVGAAASIGFIFARLMRR